MTLPSILLTWYRANARDLPFRGAHDPYAIWVSEIMAQQTRITAMSPYFEAFMRSFPDVASLAAASEHDALKAWEGLGYYSRALCLRRSAQIITEAYEGRIPDTREALMRLPGVGDYTAGAILSIAFGRREPAVDGNVLRVWARVVNNHADISQPATKKAAWAWVYDLMGNETPGDVTQALMELGALICVPKSPRCGECPFVGLCAARAIGQEGVLPVKPAKKPHRVESHPVLMIFDPDDHVFMRRRQETLLRGLWEFPSETPSGVKILSCDPLGKATHTFTHIKWEMDGYLCQAGASDASKLPENCVWADAALFDSLAIPSAFRAFRSLVLKKFNARESL